MRSGAPRVRVLLNPKASAGGAALRIAAIREALQRRGLGDDVVLTRGPGHATRLAEQAARDGVDVLAVAGGDGTLGEVAQAYVDAEGAPRGGPEVAVIPLGTGGDLRRSLRMTTGIDAAVERVRSGVGRAIDLGFLELSAPVPAGVPLTRVFVNVASFGLGGEVDDAVNHGPKWLGGRAAFFLATVRALPSFTPPEVRVRLDGAVLYEGSILNVAIANGRYFGGGMFIAPEASLDDGALDVVVVEGRGVGHALALGLPLYVGSHVRKEGVRVARGRVVEAEVLAARGAVRFDIDGEAIGARPARARVVPAAMKVRV